MHAQVLGFIACWGTLMLGGAVAVGYLSGSYGNKYIIACGYILLVSAGVLCVVMGLPDITTDDDDTDVIYIDE